MGIGGWGLVLMVTSRCSGCDGSGRNAATRRRSDPLHWAVLPAASPAVARGEPMTTSECLIMAGATRARQGCFPVVAWAGRALGRATTVGASTGGVIVDNSSTHTTQAIRDVLAAHPRVHLHFTPTSASWLNAVETSFGQLERRALRSGIFTSVTELREAMCRFIETHDTTPPNPSDGPRQPTPFSTPRTRAREALRK